MIDLLGLPERLDEGAMTVQRQIVIIPALGQLAAYPLEEAESSALGDAVHGVDLPKAERLDAIVINGFDRLHGRTLEIVRRTGVISGMCLRMAIDHSRSLARAS